MSQSPLDLINEKSSFQQFELGDYGIMETDYAEEFMDLTLRLRIKEYLSINFANILHQSSLKHIQLSYVDPSKETYFATFNQKYACVGLKGWFNLSKEEFDPLKFRLKLMGQTKFQGSQLKSNLEMTIGKKENFAGVKLMLSSVNESTIALKANTTFDKIKFNYYSQIAPVSEIEFDRNVRVFSVLNCLAAYRVDPYKFYLQYLFNGKKSPNPETLFSIVRRYNDFTFQVRANLMSLIAGDPRDIWFAARYYDGRKMVIKTKISTSWDWAFMMERTLSNRMKGIISFGKSGKNSQMGINLEWNVDY